MLRNYCRSVISLQEPLPHSLWISLDLHGILAVVWTPAYSVISFCMRWPPKHRVYNSTSSSLLHRKYLLLLCCLLKVSQYRLALIDTASVHIVKGIFQHIHNTVTDHADLVAESSFSGKLQTTTNGLITQSVAGVSVTTLGGRDGLFSLIVVFFLVLV